MIVCPVCGFRNPDLNDQCFRCSALLKRKPETVDEAFDRADKITQRHMRRQRWAAPIERLRESAFMQRLNVLPDDERYRYPFTAGLLSILWPGSGHLYCGQNLKGALLMAISAAVVLLAWITVRESWSNYLLAAMLLFWLYAWATSVALALRTNGAGVAYRHIFALFFAAMFLFGSAVALGQFLGLGVFSIEKITSANMAPYLVQGERVLFTPVPLWFRSPRRGEFIAFDPPRFEAQQRGDSISINIRRYYQRVVGIGGDTIRKEGQQFFRNGRVLPADEIPFGSHIMGDFELTVPAGKLYAPVTLIPEADLLAMMAGAPTVTHMGAPDFIFIGWKDYPYVTEDEVLGKGVVVIDPPERRRWLK